MDEPTATIQSPLKVILLSLVISKDFLCIALIITWPRASNVSEILVMKHHNTELSFEMLKGLVSLSHCRLPETDQPCLLPLKLE